MASFPSRHIRKIFGSGLGRRRRGQRISAAGVSVLAAERLEQRATMAADCCPDWVDWSAALPGDQQESWPAYEAEDCSTTPAGYAPPTDPGSSPFAPEEDSWDTAAYRDLMAALAAEAQAEAERQANEEARRQAAMMEEMAAFFANQALIEGAGSAGDADAFSDTVFGSSAPQSPVDEYGADGSSCCSASPASVGEDACGDGGYTGPNEPVPTTLEGPTEEATVVGPAPVSEGPVSDEGFVPDIDYVYDWDADERQRQADEERERLIYEASEREIAAAIAREGRMAQGADRSIDEPVAGPTGDESIPADALAAFGQSSLTVSGVTPQQVPLVDIPTLSLTDTAPRSIDAATSPPLASSDMPMGMTLVTTVSSSSGDVYGFAPACEVPSDIESSRWTALDRTAKMAADAAYKVNDGGLLPTFVAEYDPTGIAGKYGRWGFSATLSRAADYDPQFADGIYILAYRGSTWSVDDWWANAVQLFGGNTAQFQQSISLARDVSQSLPADATLITTGHSKGGAQAVAASFATGVSAITFNPSSVSPTYAQGVPGTIRTHVTFADPLSILRTVQNGLELFDPPALQQMRTVSGDVVVHPPRSLWTHGLDSLPD